MLPCGITCPGYPGIFDMKVGKPTFILAYLNWHGSSGFGMKISQIAEEIGSV
jgi:hypothetical protein